jgi:beta-glucuronidase
MINRLKILTQYLKFYVLGFCFLHFIFSAPFAFTEEILSSEEYVKKSWEVLGQRKWQEVLKYTNECIKNYKQEADRQEASLSDFPPKGKEGTYQVLNDVATCYFIQAESLMRQGKFAEAKKIFRFIIDNYKFAQAWDPRGWFWSVAEKSQISIDKLENVKGLKKKIKKEKKSRVITKLKLQNPGKEKVVNYGKYGKFVGVGTKDYKYIVIDQKGLLEAVGEGIYPNTGSVLKDPNYIRAQKQGRLRGNHWDFIYGDDMEANFYKWATAHEPWGVKLFYIGLALERAGYINHAIKAYYAIVVHFPGSVGWTYWHTPWYPGQAAIAKIRFLIRRHPELGLRFENAKIIIKNGFDNNIRNDIVITNPGTLRRIRLLDKIKDQFFTIKKQPKEIKRIIGEGKVKLIQYKNNHWQLMVDGKPYIIKAVTYTPTKVGQSPDEGTLLNWMEEDYNKNGKVDGPYDAWVDKNRNGKQDIDEPAVGDFQLMKEMGVNTIRLYIQPFGIKKELLRDLYENYGIRVILGNFLGKYTLGSGASWYEGTDYENAEHKRNMLESVKKMVLEFKDEPYVLMWLLGNENNYGVACNADKKPEAFYKFVNEAARLIKSLDKNHPVAIANGDTLFLDIFAKNCPDVDIFAANAYRGDYGFGSFWEQVYDATGKAAFITEYGCPAFMKDRSYQEAEESQSNYHLGCWEDIEYNMAGGKGTGNALGGVIFEWLDEWWKAYEPYLHDTEGLFRGPFPEGFMYEEWLGICGQGDGSKSPFLRVLRKSYYTYQELWK